MRSQPPLRQTYTPHTTLSPLYTHLLPATLPTARDLLLPTNATYTLKTPTGTTTAPPADPQNTLTAVCLTPTHAVTAHRSGHVVFHPRSSPAPSRTIRPFRDERVISHIAPDPTFTYLALGSADACIRVYSADGATLTHALRVPDAVLTCLSFAPSATTLLAGLEDGRLAAFDLATKKSAPRAVASAHVRRVTGLSFADGRIVSVAADGVLACAKLDKAQFGQHRLSHAREPIVAVAPVGERVVTVGERGVLRVWDVMRGAELPDRALALPFVSAHATRDEQDDDGDAVAAVDMRVNGSGRLVVALSDQTLLFVSFTPDAVLTLEDQVFCGNLEEVYDLRALPGADERDFALATNSSTLWLMTLHAQQPLKPAPLPADNGAKPEQLGSWSCRTGLLGHTGIILSVDARAPKTGGALLVSGSRDRTARVWRQDDEKWGCIGVAEGHTDAVAAVALSPKTGAGQAFVVTGAADRTLKLWPLDAALKESSDCAAKLSARWTVLAHAKDVNAVAVSPDGSYVASGSQDRTLKIWKSDKGNAHLTCSGHKRGIWSVAFSPVDRIVASTSGDATIRLWSVANGACLRTLQGHMAGVLKSVFVSAGTQIVSTGADGLLKVWLTRSGECGATVDAHNDRAWALDSVDDGSAVVSGAADGRVRVWTDATELVRDAERKKREEEALVGQAVLNAARGQNWAVAARGALELGMTQKLRDVVTELVKTADDVEKEIVEMVTGMLDAREGGEDDKWELVQKLLLCCRDWVASGGARSAAVGAFLLQGVFSVWCVDKLCDKLPGEQRALVEALQAHVERHLTRIADLETRVALLEHTLEQMRGLGEVDEAGETMKQAPPEMRLRKKRRVGREREAEKIDDIADTRDSDDQKANAQPGDEKKRSIPSESEHGKIEKNANKQSQNANPPRQHVAQDVEMGVGIAKRVTKQVQRESLPKRKDEAKKAGKRVKRKRDGKGIVDVEG